MKEVDGLVSLSEACRVLGRSYVWGYESVRTGRWASIRKDRHWYLATTTVAEMKAVQDAVLAKRAALRAAQQAFSVARQGARRRATPAMPVGESA